MARWIGIAWLAVLTAAWTGCLHQPKDTSETGTITLDIEAMQDTLQPGDSLQIIGTVKASGPLEFNYRILNSTGENVLDAKLYVRGDTTITTREKDWNLSSNEKLYIFTSRHWKDIACGGVYTLEITAGVIIKQDTLKVDDATFDFYLIGPSCNGGALVPDLSLASDSMGAQNATLGSALDLDEFKVHTKTSAESNSADMDLFLGDLTSGTQLFSPSEAKAFTTLFVNAWATANATLFYKSTLAGDFMSLKTIHQLNMIWSADQGMAQKTSFNAGDVFLVKTNKGKVTALRIDNISGSGGATVIAISSFKAN